MLIAGRPKSEAEPHIVDAIYNGLFTPFLGAGASSLRALNTDLSLHPWDQVLRTMKSIASQLDSPSALRFLRSFASQRLRLDDKEVDAHLPFVNNPSAAYPRDPIFEGNKLLVLQAELVKATEQLTRYFGARFAEETPSIHRLPDCSVRFDPGKPEAKEPLSQLFKAAAAARNLQQADMKQRNSPFLKPCTSLERNIEAQRVHHKLLTLIVILLGRRREAFNSKLRLHVEGRGVPVREEIWNGTAPDSGYLRLDAVQWLSEVVWYTLRYWIPCYPTTAEMAFELSLLVDDAPPRRAELAQAAQALENFDAEALAAEIRDLFLYCDECQRSNKAGSKGTWAFYYGVATALQHQYDLFAARKGAIDPHEDFRDDDDSDEPNDSSTPEVDLGAPIPPIVFTTNFDNSLENVFEENGLAFHVVYPMLSVEKGKSLEGQLIWWFRSYFPSRSHRKSEDVRWETILKANERPDFKKIIGPMIVKLHGAPCISKPNDTSHTWMVLSELGYLQALGGQASMPKWLNQQLGTGTSSRRSLWFLGYSISDWNVRLRLFEHIKVGGVLGERSTVDREKDPYRTALFEKIKVQHWVEDLTRIPDMVFYMFRTRKFTKSPEVLRLLQGLADHLEERI